MVLDLFKLSEHALSMLFLPWHVERIEMRLNLTIMPFSRLFFLQIRCFWTAGNQTVNSSVGEASRRQKQI